MVADRVIYWTKLRTKVVRTKMGKSIWLCLVSALLMLLVVTIVLRAAPANAGWPGNDFWLTVYVSPSGGGIVKVNQASLSKYPSTSTFTSGESVHLEAIATSGYRFANWSGDINDITNPITIVMDCNRKVTANFLRTGPSWSTISGIIIGTVIIIGMAAWYTIKRRRSFNRLDYYAQIE